MIALRVSLNGKFLCTAGADDLAVLNAIVGAVGNLGPQTKKTRDEPPDLSIRVGGLTGREDRADEHLGWVTQPVVAGDRVEIELLETSVADEPVETEPLDAERQLANHRKQFEYAKEFYFTFRSKFESE